MHDLFRLFAFRVSQFIGSVWALSLLIVFVIATGFIYKFSTEWKINTEFVLSIGAIAFLIFLQKSQNHNDKATHLKLDELIKSSEGARDEIAEVENQAEEDLEKLKKEVNE
jgi:low affinity Fe/Cu permease